MRIGSFAVTAVAVVSLAACTASNVQDIPTWQAELTLRIGDVDDPEYSFNRIGAVAFDAGGRIYVADQGDFRIRVYGRDGRHLRDFGREGDGPGEFRFVTAAGVLPDTIWVADWRLNRLTYFDSLGNVLGTTTSTARYDDPSLRPGVPTFLLKDGTGFLTPAYPAERTELVPQLIVRRDGAIVDTVGFHDPTMVGITIERPNGALHIGQVFPLPILQATSPDGTWRAEAKTAPLGGLAPGHYRATVLTLRGDTVWQQDFETESRPFPRNVADSMIAARYAALSAHVSISRSEFEDAVGIPEFEPPISGLWISNDGALWLKHNDADSVATWSVTDSRGSVAANVKLPARTAVRSVEGDTLWGVERDEMDVGSVVRYRIHRQPKWPAK